MYLTAIATQTPPHTFTQQECWERFVRSPTPKRLKDRSVALIEKVLLGDNGVDQRHFAIPELEHLFEWDAETLNRRFEVEAPALAGDALSKALDQASLRPADLDGLIICTCTGYLCPGITSHVAEDLGLRPEAYLADLVGLGCGAAIPALRTGNGFLAAQPDATVAIIAVEICSAAFYLEDNPGVLISACLFGDGATATIWTGQPHSSDPPLRCHGFDTVHIPEAREKLRFENRNGKLRNKLHRSVPEVAAGAVADLFSRTHQADKPLAAVAAHTGGRDVLDALQPVLPDYPLDVSREILRTCGNVSSPSVLMAAEAHLKNCWAPAAGDLWLVSFGAGFACHSCRLGKS